MWGASGLCASGLGAAAADGPVSRWPIDRLVARASTAPAGVIGIAASPVLEVGTPATVCHAGLPDSGADGVTVRPHVAFRGRRTVVCDRGLALSSLADTAVTRSVGETHNPTRSAVRIVRGRVDAGPVAAHLARYSALWSSASPRNALELRSKTHAVDARAIGGSRLTAAGGCSGPGSSLASVSCRGRIGRRAGRRGWTTGCPARTAGHARRGAVRRRAARSRADASWSCATSRRKRSVVVGTAGASGPGTDYRSQQIGNESCRSDHGLSLRLARESGLSNGRDRREPCRNSIRRNRDVVPV